MLRIGYHAEVTPLKDTPPKEDTPLCRFETIDLSIHPGELP